MISGFLLEKSSGDGRCFHRLRPFCISNTFESKQGSEVFFGRWYLGCLLL